MPDRSRKKKPRKHKPAEDDPNVAAKRIVDKATGGENRTDPSGNGEPTTEQRSEAARMLGRVGGLKGGPARARKLSKKKRQDIARRAAEARWKKNR